MGHSYPIMILLGVGLFFGIDSAFADPHTIEAVLDSGFSQDCVTDGCYTPSTVTVDVGHIITMTNGDDPSVHTFTSGTVDGFTPTPSDVFDSGILNPGESFEWSADTVGEYPYYCMRICIRSWLILWNRFYFCRSSYN